MPVSTDSSPPDRSRDTETRVSLVFRLISAFLISEPHFDGIGVGGQVLALRHGDDFVLYLCQCVPAEINNAHLQNEIKLENKDPIELSNNQFNEFTIQSSHNIENINEQNIEQPVLNHEEKKEIPNTKAPTIETPIINDNNDKKSNNQTSSRSRLEELNQRLSNRKKKKVLNNSILSKQAEQKKINNDNTNTSNNNLNIPPKNLHINGFYNICK